MLNMKFSNINALKIALVLSVFFLSPIVNAEDSSKDNAQLVKSYNQEQKKTKTQADYEREAREAKEAGYDEYSDEELVAAESNEETSYGSYSYGSTSFGFRPH